MYVYKRVQDGRGIVKERDEMPEVSLANLVRGLFV